MAMAPVTIEAKSSGHLMYRIVTMFNNILSYILNLLGLLLFLQATKTKVAMECYGYTN
jgi:hypothetical protein